MLSAATFLSLAMQCASSVHPDTSKDIARVESGFNPLVIGVVGQSKGIYPTSLNDALAHVKRLQAKGKNFSIGLMQINQANFKKYGVTAEKMFDPCANLAVFEKIITDCYQRGGTLKRALSCYYSGNFTTGQKPEGEYAKTSYVQRIGYSPTPGNYAVPSTQADRNGQSESQPLPADTTPPSYESWDVLREYPRAPTPTQKPQSKPEPVPDTATSTGEKKNV